MTSTVTKDRTARWHRYWDKQSRTYDRQIDLSNGSVHVHTVNEAKVDPESSQRVEQLRLLDHDRLEPCAFRDPTHDAICDRDENSSLVSICSTWPSTVRGERTSDSAIARLLKPSATSSAIWFSRLVNGDGAAELSLAVWSDPRAFATAVSRVSDAF